MERRARRVPEHGGASVDPSIGQLVASIRSGEYDADASLYDALAETVETAASIWKPAKSAPAS